MGFIIMVVFQNQLLFFFLSKENHEALANELQAPVDAGGSIGGTASYYGRTSDYFGGNFSHPGYIPSYVVPNNGYGPYLYRNQHPMGRGDPNFSFRNPQQFSQSHMSQGSNQHSAIRPGFNIHNA